MKRVLKLGLAGVAGTAFVAWNALRRRSWFDLEEKTVLITGGSRGLGLQLAREFGKRKARVAICARNQQELERARQDLLRRNISAFTLQCDISKRDEAETMVEEATRQCGPIDVLVNNAGIITVGPIWQQTVEDFERAMGTIFWGTLYPTMAVLPSMRQRGQGRIVNITSIGGKISVPHLIPYGCAKFAVVALSEGLRAELASDGIRIITIVPGLMRTGSHHNAEFKGDHAREYAWFSTAAASPFFSIAAQRAARSVVAATVRGKAEKVLSLPAELAARFHGISPATMIGTLSLMNRWLPYGPDSKTDLRSGEEAERQLEPRFLKVLNSLGEKAAKDLNQLVTVS